MPFRTMRFWTVQLVALSLAAMFFLACEGGDGLPSGPSGVFETSDSTENGAMQAMVTDDPDGTGSTAYSGTMTGKGDVEVSTNNKTWYTMGAPRDFTLELRSTGTKVELTASAEVPSGVYRFVRINWSGTAANLNAGSQVGSLTLDSDVTLRLGDASTAVMSQEVAGFDLTPDGQARIVVDLNSEGWMKEEFVRAREIRKEDFEDAAEINIVADTDT